MRCLNGLRFQSWIMAVNYCFLMRPKLRLGFRATFKYIRLHGGFMYLVAVMDWCSRYVLSWAVSITMDVGFCLEALDQALGVARPEIFNSDQGAQFTSLDFTGRLAAVGIQISMDGRGRALDNVFIERLWRTLKYEEVYVKDYETPQRRDRG